MDIGAEKAGAALHTSGRVDDTATPVSGGFQGGDKGLQLQIIPAFKTSSQGRDGLLSEEAGTIAKSGYSLKLDGSSLYLFISS